MPTEVEQRDMELFLALLLLPIALGLAPGGLGWPPTS